jgi:hypothetical protein
MNETSMNSGSISIRRVRADSATTEASADVLLDRVDDRSCGGGKIFQA